MTDEQTESALQRRVQALSEPGAACRSDGMAYAASIGEAEIVAEDLPIGGLLVGEAPTVDIFHIRGLAAVRLATLQTLQNALSTQETVALQQMVLSLA